jgi:nucleoside-diphosphate-sugar epimerase
MPNQEFNLADFKIVLTGHRGFVGRNLVQVLRGLRADVVCLEGDIREPATWAGTYDVVCHLAALGPDRQASSADLMSVNRDGTRSALKACVSQGARIVMASTCGVYRSSARALAEDDDVDPSNHYTKSKLEAERLCVEYSDQFDVPATILRFFNVYGTGQKEPFLIPYLIRCCLRGQSVVLKSPESKRDFVFIDDVVQAIVGSLDVPAGFRIYNVGSGKPRPVVDLVRVLEAATGRPIAWTGAPEGSPVSDCFFADITRISEELGWHPHVDLEYGLASLIEGVDQ